MICIIFSRHGKVKRKATECKGRQVITLNLTITLRVTLVRDFVKSLFTLYIYTIFKMVVLYKTSYRVPFKHDYVHIKDFYTIYVVSCLMVLNILKWYEMIAGVV